MKEECELKFWTKPKWLWSWIKVDKDCLAREEDIVKKIEKADSELLLSRAYD
jgi:hypothetical protein